MSVCFTLKSLGGASTQLPGFNQHLSLTLRNTYGLCKYPFFAGKKARTKLTFLDMFRRVALAFSYESKQRSMFIEARSYVKKFQHFSTVRSILLSLSYPSLFQSL